MPLRKSVLSLSNLCVLSLTQFVLELLHIQDEEILGRSLNKVDLSDEENGNSTKIVADEDERQIIVTQKDTERQEGNDENENEELPQKINDDCAANPNNEEEPKENTSAQNNGENVLYEMDVSSDDSTARQDTNNTIEVKSTNVAKTNSKSLENISEELRLLRKGIGRQLTCHSHAVLHELLFSSITARLDPLYMKHKHVRAPARDVMPAFLNASLREFDFGAAKMFSEADMCKVMFDHLHHASNLEKLIIGRSCYWRSNIFEDLGTKLVSLSRLMELGIQYICTPEMISGLSSSCPNLITLNLKGSEKITDTDTEEIAKCKSLTSLDISGTKITGRGCWKIVESIKRLNWLQHCAYNCNSDSVLFESRTDLFNRIKEQLIHGNASTLTKPELNQRDIKFNLKNFWLFNPTTEDLCRTVLFPDMEHLRLDFVFQDLAEEPDVSLLSALPKLNRFTANLYDRCHMGLVRQMVEACGNQLSHLELHLADDWFFVAEAHNVVAACCPNLETLVFSGDYKSRHSLEDSNGRLDWSLPGPAHPRLEVLRVTGVVTNDRLRFLLSHTPNLRILNLDGELEWLHDATFTAILDVNPLPELEEVWLNVSTTVSLDTVRLLLLAHNRLRVVGRLCHMAGATMDDYQHLLATVRANNLDSKLIWVTDERIK